MDGNFGCTFFFFFFIWFKAIALTGPGVGNSSTVRGHFHFITCLVDQTKLGDNTRCHIPTAGTVSDVRGTDDVCSWLSTLGQMVHQWNQILQRPLPALPKFAKHDVILMARTKNEKPAVEYAKLNKKYSTEMLTFIFLLYVSYRPPTTLI